MVDCKNYRYQNIPKDEWCREGVDTSLCKYGDRYPFYEQCKDEDELEEQHYPDEIGGIL